MRIKGMGPGYVGLLRETYDLVVASDGVNSTVRGRYAGAFGPTQFMPTVYKTYAVDADGDGHTNVEEFLNGTGTGDTGTHKVPTREKRSHGVTTAMGSNPTSCCKKPEVTSGPSQTTRSSTA